MGHSYWFECAKCGYRARVSGRADRGLNFHIQTILCRDCRELYDAVTRLRLPVEAGQPAANRFPGAWQPLNGFHRPKRPAHPPSFHAALTRLQYTRATHFAWIQFPLQCPVSPHHHVRDWHDPSQCPRCGVYLEKNALPYRIWE